MVEDDRRDSTPVSMEVALLAAFTLLLGAFTLLLWGSPPRADARVAARYGGGRGGTGVRPGRYGDLGGARMAVAVRLNPTSNRRRAPSRRHQKPKRGPRLPKVGAPRRPPSGVRPPPPRLRYHPRLRLRHRHRLRPPLRHRHRLRPRLRPHLRPSNSKSSQAMRCTSITNNLSLWEAPALLPALIHRLA